jgi:hypothetical protein
MLLLLLQRLQQQVLLLLLLLLLGKAVSWRHCPCKQSMANAVQRD